jgi:Holliday junction resolvase RusA-like endonuclease
MNRTHWAKKRTLKQEYALLIRNQMRLNNIEQLLTPTTSTLYILSLRKRKLDHDNLVGGSKQLIDALCDEGCIWDDCTKFLSSLIVEQVKANTDMTLIKRIV